MGDQDFAWPAWKFGLKQQDLFTTLVEQYNSCTIPLQDPEAFYHDVYEISNVADSTEEFHRLMARRKANREGQLSERFETLALEIIASPPIMSTEQWPLALQLFRTKSFDALVRYIASYVPGLLPGNGTEPSGQEGHEPNPPSPSAHAFVDATSDKEPSGNLQENNSGRPKDRKRRNGCVQCRSRRVKCDEARPSCSACSRRDRACVYPSSPILVASSQMQGLSLSSELSLDGSTSGKWQPDDEYDPTDDLSRPESHASSALSASSQVSDESVNQIKTDLQAMQALVQEQIKRKPLKFPSRFWSGETSNSPKYEYENAVRGLLQTISDTLERRGSDSGDEDDPNWHKLHQSLVVLYDDLRVSFKDHRASAGKGKSNANFKESLDSLKKVEERFMALNLHKGKGAERTAPRGG